MSGAAVGVDVGGTFTDAVFVDGGGDVHVAKARSTPDAAEKGFIDCLERLSLRTERRLEDVGYLAHGSTIATNAIVQRRLTPTALLTNVGFRDILEIGTQQRQRLYDLWTPKPSPVVRREWCYEVRGRIGADGAELEPLCEEDVGEVAKILRDKGIEAVAVTFLFSFFNPDHEIRAGEILRAELPNLAMSLSSDIAPEFREYLRASTTAVNASLLPLVGQYLQDVTTRLAERSVQAPLHMMQSNGGVATASVAARVPVGLIASGPAAGVIGAARVGGAVSAGDVLTFDMGGTTADVAVVLDGLPQLRFNADPGGFPVNLPQIDVLSIGAGGGSIVRVDEFGGLTVGPDSAGAKPGPACYGAGGYEPTVTDAHVTLGAIAGERALGGVVNIDPDLARAVIGERIAEPLGLSCEEAASAIIRITNANMTNALRVVSIARGHDPRRFSLVAFGGAGPLHACSIAEELGVTRVIVPRHPGVAAALGLLLTEVRHDLRRTWISATEEVDPHELDSAVVALEHEACELLGLSGHSPENADIAFELDMRYRGQAYNLTVPLFPRPVTSQTLDLAEASFHAAHQRAYDYTPSVTDTEIVTLRARAVGTQRNSLHAFGSSNGQAKGSRKRELWFGGTPVEFSVLDRNALAPGAEIKPASLIEQEDSTTLVPPMWRGRATEGGLLLLEREHQ